MVVSMKSICSPTPVDSAPGGSTGKKLPGPPSASRAPSSAMALTSIKLGTAHGPPDTFVRERTETLCCPAPSGPATLARQEHWRVVVETEIGVCPSKVVSDLSVRGVGVSDDGGPTDDSRSSPSGVHATRQPTKETTAVKTRTTAWCPMSALLAMP